MPQSGKEKSNCASIEDKEKKDVYLLNCSGKYGKNNQMQKTEEVFYTVSSVS